VVVGDVSARSLGLSAAKFLELATGLDAVVHAAAQVNLLLPYASLRDANVAGTAHVLELALAARRKVKFVYISSSAVVCVNDGADTQPVVLDGTFEQLPQQPRTGYGQTKRASEAVVLGVAKRTPLVQPHVVRLGNVGPSTSAPNVVNTDDVSRLIMASCLALGAVPERLFLEASPRDIVAGTIVGLLNPEIMPPPVAQVVHPGRTDARLLLPPGTQTLSLPKFLAKARGFVESKQGTEVGRTVEKCLFLLSSQAAPEMLRVPAFSCAATVAATRVAPPELSMDYLMAAFGGARESPNGATQIVSSPSSIKLEEEKDGMLVVSPLAGKLVVVIGASSGIGAGIARALVGRGALVAALARRRCPPGTGHSISVDVTRRGDIERAIAEAEAFYEAEISVLVNSAGVMFYEEMSSMDRDAWQATVDVNVMGTVHALGAAMELMVSRQTRGDLVLLSSDAGRSPFDGLAVYSGSKHFVEGTARALRRELAPKGIRVTCIQPGNVDTLLASMARDEEALNKYGARTGNKVLEPADVANAVLFALEQPPHSAVNEILIEPIGEPL
jgi:NADP-dependent 3-hydroxy acid dehydrogenase YdfG/thioester reductase-like protein